MSDRWVVLKFGGTSVASARTWEVIAQRARQLMPENRVLVVVSALAGVSDHLEEAIEESVEDKPGRAFSWLRDAHQSLSEEVPLERQEFEPVHELLDDLGRLLEGVRLTQEASPRLRARVMSFGEMASSRLGETILRHHGLDPSWVDARDFLQSHHGYRDHESMRYLDADVPARTDPEFAEKLVGDARLVLTQGFLARTPNGETCLLGRGGSDTSAALFSALFDAERLEVWTDVHGMFTADPRQIPSARLIGLIGYREAQELAAMGARVLHPRCLGPVAASRIPLTIRNSEDPEAAGTRIADYEDSGPAVMAVVCRRGVTMLTMSTLKMWEASGFLARAFRPFEELGISIDLVATSESAVTVTLDRIPGGVQGETFAELIEKLSKMSKVEVVHPCAVVSIVGRKIRTVLHELGPAMSVFREHQVHLVTESSEDLNLSFVVDEGDAAPLVESLHARLFPSQSDRDSDPRFGPSWEALEAARHGTVQVPRADDDVDAPPAPWWARRRDALLELTGDGKPRYVYDLETVAQRAAALRETIPSVGRFYYSMKANNHPRVLETVRDQGFGLECVSIDEVRHARKVCGAGVPILFTPNFAAPAEYTEAMDLGAEVTIDSPEILALAGDLFRGVELGIRVDPGGGLGHHQKVRTAGANSKFGHPAEDMESILEASAAAGARVIGLHAHVGSGVRDAGAWARTALALKAASAVPDLRWLDLGGGLGVVERPGQDPLDLDHVESSLDQIRSGLGAVELRMEPGRYLVSEAGVLIAPVNLVRDKAGVRFVGLATGMNSLMRPALYGAWHAIHNLSRLGEPADGYAHVVGPICESSDVLGRDRLLPRTEPGDWLLIENCGAYGATMASRYNLREPAEEVVLEAQPTS